MKNLIKRLSFIFLSLIVFSCVNDDDTNIPIPEDSLVNLETNTTIEEIINEFELQTETVYEFESGKIFKGIVVSSDEHGNFFKELVIQSDNQSIYGINLDVDVRDLYLFTELGRIVYIKLDGLGLKKEKGEYIIGKLNGNSIESIPEFLFMDVLKRENSTFDYFTEINPNILTPEQINAIDFNSPGNNINALIELQNVQVGINDIGNTYSGNETDNFDGERNLIYCNNLESFILSTSVFADFKSIPLNSGLFNIRGILKRDFDNEKFIIKINSLNDITSLDQERCDPSFSYNFNNDDLGDFDNNDWTNFSESGNVNWEVYSDDYSLGKSIRLNPFNSGGGITKNWLITPQQTSETEILNFVTSNSFSDNSTLKLYYSIDWNGNESTINSSNWIELNANIVEDSVFFQDWVNSGNIDVSFINTDFYISFVYEGDGGGASSMNNGTYELDNINIY